MAKYRTAMGKVVDMTTLVSRNEKVRAVGNMKVNARGDTIDSAGRIIKPVTAKVNEAYGKTVGNRGSHQVATKPAAPPKPKLEELTELEKELEESMQDDIEVEQIKEKEVKKQNERTSVRSNKSQSNKAST